MDREPLAVSTSFINLRMAVTTQNINSSTSLPVTNSSDLKLNRSLPLPTLSPDMDAAVAGGNSVQLALTVLQSLILTFAVLGNLITLSGLYLYKRHRKKLTRMYLFILHLCIADLSVALFNVAPNLCMIASFPDSCPFQTSTASCKTVNYLSLASVYGSTYVLVMTAVDRFLAICFPLWSQRLGDRHVHIMVMFAWIASLAFSIPQVVVFQYDDETLKCITKWHSNNLTHSYYESMYVGWFTTAVWILPTIIIAICYISITVVVWNRGNSLLNKGDTTSSINQKSQRARLLKPIQLTLAVILCYVFCWSPWMLSMLILHFSPNIAANMTQTGGIVAELLTYLIGFNSCLNPWIYFCFNCKNFVIKPRKRKLHTNLTMTTQTQLNTERASIQLSQSCSNRELQEELTPLTETRAIVIENGDAVHV